MTKTKSLLFTAGIVLAMAFTLSCSDSGGGGGYDSGGRGGNSSSSVGSGGGSIVYGNPVTYEGETYETVVIGTQTWFAKNLNYAVEGSVCYDNDPANCTKYGRLYDWSTAMALDPSCNNNTCSGQIQSPHRGICPSGWHIPSDGDWNFLMDFVGGSSTAGKKLKATSGWHSSGNGTDEYGFSALPGGYGYLDGSFDYAGSNGYWWSASEYSSNFAYRRRIYYLNGDTFWNDFVKSYLFSVRCLQD